MIFINYYLFVFLTLAAFPRVYLDGFSFAFQGIDLLIPFSIIYALINVNYLLSSVYFGGVNKYIRAYLYFPFIALLILPFSSLLLLDVTSSTNSILQILRFFPGLAFYIFLFKSNLSNSISFNSFWRLGLYFISIGSIFYLLIDSDFTYYLSPASQLTGNFLYQIFSFINIDLEFLTNRRMGGVSGSPTIWANLLLVFLLSSIVARNQKLISRSLFYFSFFICFACIIASSAKVAILGLIFYFFIFFSNYFVNFLLLLSVFLIFTTQEYIRDATSIFLEIASESADGRINTVWIDAYDFLINYFPVVIFGHGWRATVVGWHNEFLELFMGLGLFFGGYYAFYLFHSMRKFFHNIFNSRHLGFYLYSILLGSSFFQNVFFDPNFFIVIIWLHFFSVFLKSSLSQLPLTISNNRI